MKHMLMAVLATVLAFASPVLATDQEWNWGPRSKETTAVGDGGGFGWRQGDGSGNVGVNRQTSAYSYVDPRTSEASVYNQGEAWSWSLGDKVARAGSQDDGIAAVTMSDGRRQIERVSRALAAGAAGAVADGRHTETYADNHTRSVVSERIYDGPDGRHTSSERMAESLSNASGQARDRHAASVSSRAESVASVSGERSGSLGDRRSRDKHH